MAVEVCPQLFLDGDQLRFHCSDRKGLDKLMKYLDKQINAGSLASVHQRIDPESKPPRLMMHRSDEAVLDVESAGEAARLVAVIEKNWAPIKEQLIKGENIEELREPNPSVLINMKMLPNEEYRGIAKIAFEVTALMLGAEVVLGDSFDPIRAYIMGDVRLPLLDGSDPNQLAIDSRFVARVSEGFPFPFTQHHGVILAHDPTHGLAAMVILYGIHHYKVSLAPKQDQRSWMRHYEFMYRKDGHGELSDLEFARRALERFPSTLNIDPGMAAEMLDVLNGKQKDAWLYEGRIIAER
jgi:hypothetical protein